MGSAASDPLGTDSPEPGASEQKPEEIWRAVKDSVGGATGALTDVEVLAVAMAAQSGSVIPIGPTDSPLTAITWMDTRSRPLVDSWPESIRSLIRRISGWSPLPGPRPAA